MSRYAQSANGSKAAASLVAAALLFVGAPWAEARPVELGHEGPVLPRSSEPWSSPVLLPSADEMEQADVLRASSTENERETTVYEEGTSGLRAFLDEVLDEGGLWTVLPKHMGVEARRRFLEDRAIRVYREGILRFPNSPFVPGASMKIASVYARRGDPGAAMHEYAVLIDRFPDDENAENARLARARLMFEVGDDADARDEAYLLIDTYLHSPLVPDAYLLAARAHEQLGELDAARLAYTHVLERTTPTSALGLQAREGIASLELTTGNVAAAIDIYEQLLADASSQSEHDAREFKLALTYLDAGQKARARALLRKILDGDRLNACRPDAAFLLADSYYADGEMPEAVQHYMNALADFPDDDQRVPALFRAADAYKQLMLYDAALEVTRQVSTSRSAAATPYEHARAKLMAAELLFADEQYGAALEAFYGALVRELTESERHQVAYRIAQCYDRSGYYNEALEAYDAATEEAPEHELAFNAALGMADCYAKKGWLDDARQHYMAILNAGGEDDRPGRRAARSRAAFRLLDTYTARGLYQEELDCARALLDRGYEFLDEARLLYRVGRAYERLNNPEQARAFYTQVEAGFPDSEWAAQAAVKTHHMDMLKQIIELAN